MKKWIFLFTLILLFATANATVIEKEYYKELNQHQQKNATKLSAREAFMPLIKELKKTGLPVSYLLRALPAVRAVYFETLPDQVFGSYNSLTRNITLRSDFINSRTKKVKKLQFLTTDQVASVYHELWHAYLDRVESRSSNLYRLWESQSQRIYRTKGRAIHNEAYGLYIESIAKNYLHFYRLFKARDMRRRGRLRSSERLAQSYIRSFKDIINGYYRNWFGRFINSNVDLPLIDRLSIENKLLNRKISRDYKKAFSEDKF